MIEILRAEQDFLRKRKNFPIAKALYCLMYFFDSLIKCVHVFIDKETEQNNCLQKDIWIAMLGSILKLTGNLTYTQMCLNRYLLVGREHIKLIEKLCWFFWGWVLCSAWLSSFRSNFSRLYSIEMASWEMKITSTIFGLAYGKYCSIIEKLAQKKNFINLLL